MIWRIISHDIDYLNEKKDEFKRDDIMTTLLLNKNITTKEEVYNYLNLSYKHLNDPFLLENMREIVNLILKLIDNDKGILIFGDYDIDGVSGSIYLSKILSKLNIKNDIYISPKSILKYSLNDDFFKKISSGDFSLVISVDNSFGSEDDINLIKEKGVEVIITDHHLNEKKYKGVLELNPKKSPNYPFKELSGSGVVFKLVQAIYYTLGNREMSEIYEYCELVALATIADVMECVDENRFLIKRGLKNFANSKIKALSLIFQNFKINPEYITINDVSYRIAPLINAFAKLNDPTKILNFLTSESDEDVVKTISEMYEYNKERKKYENQVFEKISNKFKIYRDKIKYIYYEINDVNIGTMGSLASKLALEFRVPVILISIEGNYCKGSCRSIADSNIYDFITKFSEYYINFGGHDLAAGFLITKKDLNLIKRKIKNGLINLSKKIRKTHEIVIDKKVSLEEISIKKIKEIQTLGPFGLSNSEPNFYDEDIVFKNIFKFGVENNHFKASVYKNGKEFNVLGYNLVDKLDLKKTNKSYKIIYTPELVSKNTIRLKLKDIK